MTENTNGLDRDGRRVIDEYLDAVDRALADAGRDRSERRNVTDDVEAQILDMLAARAGNSPTRADAEALLAELDSPEAYAAESQAETPGPPIEGRFSRAAIIGAAWAPFCFVFLWTLLFADRVQVVSGNETPPPPAFHWWQWVLLFTVVPLGATAPFGTTILGIVSISQIRQSAGRLYGLGLAMLDALLFPLLALDIVICYVVYGIVSAISKASSTDRLTDTKLLVITAITILICVVVDVVIAVCTWRALTRSSRLGETEKEVDPAEARKQAQMGMLALVVCLGGLVLAVTIAALGRHMERDATMAGFGVFIAAQVAALVLGILSRREPMGNATRIISAIFLVASLIWLGLTMG